MYSYSGNGTKRCLRVTGLKFRKVCLSNVARNAIRCFPVAKWARSSARPEFIIVPPASRIAERSGAFRQISPRGSAIIGRHEPRRLHQWERGISAGAGRRRWRSSSAVPRQSRDEMSSALGFFSATPRVPRPFANDRRHRPASDVTRATLSTRPPRRRFVDGSLARAIIR